jgi:hypothetical protein
LKLRLRIFANAEEREECEVAELLATLRPSIPKRLALLCLEPSCEAIFEAGPPTTCPRCGGSESWPIARGLDRQPEEVTVT